MRKVLTLVLVAAAATADETIPGVRLTRDDNRHQHTLADLWHDAGEQQDWVVETGANSIGRPNCSSTRNKRRPRSPMLTAFKSTSPRAGRKNKARGVGGEGLRERRRWYGHRSTAVWQGALCFIAGRHRRPAIHENIESHGSRRRTARCTPAATTATRPCCSGPRPC